MYFARKCTFSQSGSHIYIIIYIEREREREIVRTVRLGLLASLANYIEKEKV